MDINKNHTKRGQSLVFYTMISLAGLIFLALVIEGGNIFAMRRLAQNAADAGALAGARELCATGDWINVAKPAAEKYATQNNKARLANLDSQSATALLDGENLVDVNVVINYKPFFNNFNNNMIGPLLTVVAYAQAGCFLPGVGEGVLPVAWSCRDPVNDPDPPSCAPQTIPYESSISCDLELGDPVYTVMDSGDLGKDLVCIDPPVVEGNPLCPGPAPIPDPTETFFPLDCDFDNDCINDLGIFSGGNRGWLSLDGGAGSADPKDWIDTGFPGEVFVHHWYPALTGNMADLYLCVEGSAGCANNHVNTIVTVPVFSAVCHTSIPSKETCGDEFHSIPPDPWQDVVVGTSSQDWYHVIDFSAFYISCVDGPGNADCDTTIYIRQQLLDAGYNVSNLNTLKTIEGCFLCGYPPVTSGGTGSGVGSDTWTVRLTR